MENNFSDKHKKPEVLNEINIENETKEVKELREQNSSQHGEIPNKKRGVCTKCNIF